MIVDHSRAAVRGTAGPGRVAERATGCLDRTIVANFGASLRGRLKSLRESRSWLGSGAPGIWSTASGAHTR